MFVYVDYRCQLPCALYKCTRNLIKEHSTLTKIVLQFIFHGNSDNTNDDNDAGNDNDNDDGDDNDDVNDNDDFND